MKKSGMKKSKWGIAAAMLVVFLVGGAVGAIVEHERILNDTGSDEPVISAPAARDAAVSWFGSDSSAACPALKRWAASESLAYVATLQARANWAASRSTLLRQSPESLAALRALLPAASPPGQSNIQSLVAYGTVLGNALNRATSATDYTNAQGELASTRTKRTGAILTQAVLLCPPG